MISLSDLAALHSEYADDLALPVEPVTVGGVTIGGPEAVLMGTVNLSRDSTYRESIAVSTEAADPQGAHPGRPGRAGRRPRCGVEHGAGRTRRRAAAARDPRSR